MLKFFILLRELCTSIIINHCSTRMSKKTTPRGADSPAGGPNDREVENGPDESGARARNLEAAEAAGSARTDTQRDNTSSAGLRDSFLEMRNTLQLIRPLLAQSTPISREDAHGAARRPPRGSKSAGKCSRCTLVPGCSLIIAHAFLRKFVKFCFVLRD